MFSVPQRLGVSYVNFVFFVTFVVRDAWI